MEAGLILAYSVFFLLGVSIISLGVVLNKTTKKKIVTTSANRVKKEKQNKKDFLDRRLDKSWLVQEKEKEWAPIIKISGLHITVRQFTKIKLALILLAIILSILMNNVFVIVPMCIIFSIVPNYIVKKKAKKRKARFEKQLLENFQTFVTDFSSTRNVQTTVFNMTKKSVSPLKEEWEVLSRSLNSGIPFDVCFVDFANRTGSKWTRIFAQIMISYYNQGNDFSEQLMSLTTKMNTEKIIAQENDTEISTLVTLNMVMNLAVPIIYIINKFLQPEASAAFSNTVQGRMVVLIITITCGLSLWLAHKLEEW